MAWDSRREWVVHLHRRTARRCSFKSGHSGGGGHPASSPIRTTASAITSPFPSDTIAVGTTIHHRHRSAGHLGQLSESHSRGGRSPLHRAMRAAPHRDTGSHGSMTQPHMPSSSRVHSYRRLDQQGGGNFGIGPRQCARMAIIT